MLDEEDAVAAARLCASGADRPGMRRLTAGLLVALFRGSLQGDAEEFHALDDAESAPMAVAWEAK